MGGTSTDISLVHGGELRTTNEWYVEYGHPIVFPSIEVLTIGAGGGSLATIDAAGSLRNGPQSAGSDPGPAAYGQGGEEPTNTDANLVLGRLGTQLVGGGMTLDRDAAEEAIRTKVAEPLGLELDEAARSIIEVANANMADAVRLISLQRGYDPRDFALVAFGGAGALHGAAIARDLGPAHRAGAAAARRLVGARVPDGRRPPRPVGDVPGLRRRRRPGRARGRLHAHGGRGAGPAGVRGRGARRRAPGALDRDALPGPVALDGGRGREGQGPRRRDRPVPRRARARVLLPPRRRAGRAVPAAARWPPARRPT